jgi:hypothetical protein
MLILSPTSITHALAVGGGIFQKLRPPQNPMLPVDPYLKFRKEESLKSSKKDRDDPVSCALIVSIAIPAIADKINFFIFGSLNLTLSPILSIFGSSRNPKNENQYFSRLFPEFGLP